MERPDDVRRHPRGTHAQHQPPDAYYRYVEVDIPDMIAHGFMRLWEELSQNPNLLADFDQGGATKWVMYRSGSSHYTKFYRREMYMEELAARSSQSRIVFGLRPNRLHKEEKVFSKVVRDGICLIIDLGQGNLAVLLALFPWIEEAFYERFAERQNAVNGSLQQQLERLERLLIEQGNTPIMNTSQPVGASNGGIKKLTVPQIVPPVFDDDDDVELVVRKAKDDGSSARNFLESAFALQK